jgi:hypothetical protein
MSGCGPERRSTALQHSVAISRSADMRSSLRTVEDDPQATPAGRTGVDRLGNPVVLIIARPPPTVRATWFSGGEYHALDIVACDGGAFIARRDDPGPCPGEGWQLIARQGQRGISGPRGERGLAGASAPVITSWVIDKESYSATPILSDGSSGPPLQLRELFAQFQDETAP